MSTDLKLKLALALSGSYTGSNDLAAPAQQIAFSEVLNYKFGTSANQADILFADTRTLAASGTESLDLNGVLADAFGAAVAAVEVVAVIVTADAGNTNNVEVGGAAANAFPLFKDPTDIAVVKPGGFFAIGTPTNPGYVVTPATGDLLKVTNSAAGTPITYTIIIVGRSA